MARLQIEFRGAKTVVHLGHGETTIGRSNQCTIHLPDPDLAEIHFRIQEKGGKFRLRDDGSGAGTRVNGEAVMGVTLKHGDLIEAGSLRCRVLMQGQQAAAARPKQQQARQDPQKAAQQAPQQAPQKGRAGPRPEPAAEPAVERPARTPRAPRKKSPVPMLVFAGGGVAVLAIVAYLLMQAGRREEEANALLEEAKQKFALAEESGQRVALDEARTAIDSLARDYADEPAARAAAVIRTRLDRLTDVLDTLEEAERFAASGADPDLALDWIRKVAPLTDIAPAPMEKRIGLALDELRGAQRRKAERALALVMEQARAAEERNELGTARTLWTQFETDDGISRRQADTALRDLDARIASGYRAVLKLAAQAKDIEGRIALLEANRSTFRATRQANDLEVRISALHARKRQAAYIVAKKKPVEDKPKTDDTPVETGPFVEPDKVGELVQERRYAEAASLLGSITRHPEAKLRIEELTLMATVFADLAAKAAASPETFRAILLPDRLGRANAVGADEKGIRFAVEGKPRAFTWAQLPAKSFTKLFKQAGFDKPPRLGVALFFHEETLVKEADKAFIAFFESEQAPTTFTRIYARRRGIEPPAGGFVLFRKKLHTPTERDTILLNERIAKLVKDAQRASDRKREEIWRELEQIGAPAVEALAGSIRARRDAVVAELVKSKAFSPGRWAKLFGSRLQDARRDALAYIMDDARYPYPTKTAEAQATAERLVAKVQEIWERPYPLMLEASDSAKAIDTELRALDERLAKFDPLAEPIYEEALDQVLAKLDVRTIPVPGFGRSQIEYNLAVERYNASLKNTSVDVEERANVKAVNAYRWMMGRHSVKIDERLVRAARKHSIEMQEKNYFAHDSPTPHLRTPGHRAKREGYGGGVGENIARGANNGVAVFWQWFRSSGHHRNMLRPSWTEMGCGACKHHWWTQKFGGMTGKSMNPPTVPPDPDPPGSSGA
ncbi:MAG: CAP domain-containing protein [Planctomycetota bacterium]